MASSSANKAMASASDRTNQDQQPLNCPRCDSSNTKFCYYNNYSLSQPRHFCKACKRYWTRGGTLRNVPVGGGCRKNKRHKRHSTGADGISSSVAVTTSTGNPSIQPQMNPSNHIQNPLFYGLTTNPLELNFPFSNFRVSSDAAGFDLQPQINGLGLGFSSGMLLSEESNTGFKPIQDAISNSSTSSPFSTSANNSIFFGSSSFSTSSTMASLLASTLQQHQENIPIPSLMPSEDPRMLDNGIGKQVKANGSPWNPNPNPTPTTMDQINSSDPSSLLWSTTSIAALFDTSTMGSSVTSLI